MGTRAAYVVAMDHPCGFWLCVVLTIVLASAGAFVMYHGLG
jgi:hypothetical protein